MQCCIVCRLKCNISKKPLLEMSEQHLLLGEHEQGLFTLLYVLTAKYVLCLVFA